MCCHGCAAVAQAIVAGGLADYYRFRSAPATTAVAPDDEMRRRARIYDDPAVQRDFVRIEGDRSREASLTLEGITCAACVWLNERQIAATPGVLDVQINYATHRACVRWDPGRARLSEIIAAIARIGYRAHPDRKSTRLNSSHSQQSRMPSSA